MKALWIYTVTQRSGFVLADPYDWRDAVREVERLHYHGIRIHDLYRANYTAEQPPRMKVS